jgi:hypothetical protein
LNENIAAYIQILWNKPGHMTSRTKKQTKPENNFKFKIKANFFLSIAEARLPGA